MADQAKVELRGDIPRDVADVIDASSQAKRVSRMEIVNLILLEWAEHKRYEATLIVRVTRREGSSAELRGRIGE